MTMRYMIKIMMNSMENDQGLKHTKNQNIETLGKWLNHNKLVIMAMRSI